MSPACTLRPQRESIHETYRGHLRLLLMYNFPDLYGHALRQFLQASAQLDLIPDLWTDFIEVSFPEAQESGDRGTRLQPKQVMETVSMLADYFVDLRERGPLYPRFSVYLIAFGTLFDRLIQALVASPFSVNTVAPPLLELLSPWVLGKHTREGVVDAWENHSGFSQAAGSYCLRFALFFERHGEARSLEPLLDFVLDKVLPAASPHVLETVSGALEQIRWEKLHLSEARLQRLLGLVEGQPLPSTIHLLAHLLTTKAWSAEDLGARASSAVQESRAEHLLLLFVQLLLWPVEAELRARLVATGVALPWDGLGVRALRMAFECVRAAFEPRALLEADSPTRGALSLLWAAAGGETLEQASGEGLPLEGLALARLETALEGEAALWEHSYSGLAPAPVTQRVTSLLRRAVAIGSRAGGPREGVERRLLGRVMALCNTRGSGSMELRALLAAWATLLRAATAPQALRVLSVACEALGCVVEMALLCEQSIEAAFGGAAPGSLGEQAGWEAVQCRLAAPEIAYDEFIQACVRKHCFLTLYAHGLQQLRCCRSAAEERELTSRLQIWATTCTDYRELEESEAPKLFLLWGEVLLLRLRQVHASSPHAVEALAQTAGALAVLAGRFGEDRDRAGLMGRLGAGVRSHLQVEFRAAARALAAFLQAQVLEDGALRWDRASVPGRKAKAALQELERCLRRSEYASVHDGLALVAAFVGDPSRTIQDVGGLLSLLVRHLLPGRAYLKILAP